MNKQQLAALLSQGGLTAAQIEDLLTDFLNNEKAKVRPKIDLLGAGIVEPETNNGCPFDEILKPTETQNIKPEDMVSGEWYVLYKKGYSYDWILRFLHLSNYYIYADRYCSSNGIFKGVEQEFFSKAIYEIRKATREEVTKYFPNAFDIDRVTDEQL
jgi:hypothetical protein